MCDLNILKVALTHGQQITNIESGNWCFFGYTMKREKLEHIVTAERMYVVRDTGKHREKFLDKLSLRHENVPVHEYYVLLEITGCEEWLPTGWQST